MVKVSVPKDSKPYINWRHVDGPLLCCTDGSLHWLTFVERLQFKMGEA
jgi:hypothetical protein